MKTKSRPADSSAPARPPARQKTSRTARTVGEPVSGTSDVGVVPFGFAGREDVPGSAPGAHLPVRATVLGRIFKRFMADGSIWGSARERGNGGGRVVEQALLSVNGRATMDVHSIDDMALVGVLSGVIAPAANAQPPKKGFCPTQLDDALCWWCHRHGHEMFVGNAVMLNIVCPSTQLSELDPMLACLGARRVRNEAAPTLAVRA